MTEDDLKIANPSRMSLRKTKKGEESYATPPTVAPVFFTPSNVLPSSIQVPNSINPIPAVPVAVTSDAVSALSAGVLVAGDVLPIPAPIPAPAIAANSSALGPCPLPRDLF
ncbi:GL14103 [Drosophila persimilis]|uniref:GL14103 n=1 Tax=Drosophila persimilis TaxID=7234 RepID=B4H8A2_DROPE|nr:GL14103 [Drosophila persimilis]